ncbi:serpentine type 7TM GPCR chemoreceptor str domain-containing protein [Ditylenchus destructor]|uniref:Serpentine type 7TM GPCR chemoreceptor str domain-containing protein n=1 Tax=Ditylenchus destructor TaxID=166010 RepID=A0AAD4MK57_9BILA|nr:serpentine type 7TM GPCR chemoreceptor str domain-containing protein [Ditylenchus destructor]
MNETVATWQPAHYPRPITVFGSWTPRQLQILSEEVGSSISLAANVILVALILSEKNEVLKSYSRILLLNCVVDVIYTLACATNVLQFEIYNGYFMFINNGFFKDAPMSLLYFLGWFWSWACGLAIYAIPFMFYYRYNLICKGETLTMQKFFLALLMPIIAPTFDAFVLTSSFWGMRDRRELFCQEFLNHPVWVMPNEGIPSNCLLSGDRTDIWLLLFCIGVCFKGTSVYGTTIWFGMNIHRAMKESNKKASRKTIKMQSQLTRILVIQATLPLLTAVMPCMVMLALIVFKINVRGAGLCISGMLSWIPVVNPLSSIFLVSNYRKKLLGTVLRILPKNKYIQRRLDATSHTGKTSHIHPSRQSSTAPARTTGVSGGADIATEGVDIANINTESQ